MSALPVLPIDHLDLRFEPRAWGFAEERKHEISAYFAARRGEKPALFNGRVLVMHRHAIADRVLHGAYLETDFASFLSWRDWGFPDTGMRNCFALGALRGSDGAFLLGVMGPHTANAGRIYFPGGTPDPSDIVNGRVDLEASVRREVEEETGLRAGELDFAPGWQLVPTGARLALIKTIAAREPAHVLRERILEHLAREAEPELAAIHLARTLSDLDERMPPFVHAFLHHAFEQG